MKLELLKEDFKKALIVCERLTRKNLTLPVLQNILIKTQGSFVELQTTNLESAISWKILSKIEKQGKALVPAGLLANLVNLISSEKLELKEEKGNLILSAEHQNIQIQGQDVEEFPLIPKIENKQFWQVDNQQIRQGLAQTAEIPSLSQSRPEISGILFSLKKNKLKLVGTDSFRLAEKTIFLKQDGLPDSHFILPQTSSKELLNIASQQEGVVRIYTDPSQVMFEFIPQENDLTQAVFLSRLIEGAYPNYQQIVPQKHLTQIRLEKDLLAAQIKKAGLFSGKIAEVKITTLKKDKQIKIFSQNPEAGKGELYMPSQIEGEEAEVSFNYHFLIDGLNLLKSAEVLFELNGEDKAGVLKPVGDNSYFYILMPIKAS